MLTGEYSLFHGVVIDGFYIDGTYYPLGLGVRTGEVGVLDEICS